MALQLPSVHLILVFASWMALNLGLNYYNSLVLRNTNFRFPFLLTLVNKTIGFFVATTIMYCSKGLPKPQELKADFMRPAVHLNGFLTAMNIGLNNWSLVFISLTLNQVMRSTIPLPTAILSMIFEGKTFSWQVWASMLLLVVGCALAACGALGSEPVGGIIIALGSILANATWTVTAAILMQSGAKPLDAVSLLFVSGPTCILTLVVFFCALELPRLVSFNPDPEHPVPPPEMMLLFLGAAATMASFYDIVHNQFIKLTSSMNMAIMGNTKVGVRTLVKCSLLLTL